MSMDLQNLFDGPVKPKNRKRTPNFAITFDDGYAKGWVYGVPVSFRNALDIRNLKYVDKEKTRDLRAKQKNQLKPPTAYKYVWTRGVPPSLSFSQGDVFYRPAQIRNLPWNEATKILTHSIQVLGARSDDYNGDGGWVEFQLTHYNKGSLIERISFKLSQKEFEGVLRNGTHPKLKKQKGQMDPGPLFNGLMP